MGPPACADGDAIISRAVERITKALRNCSPPKKELDHFDRLRDPKNRGSR
jgi:hypothetical protein